MSKREWPVFAYFAAALVVVWIVYSYFEALAFNRVTGSRVTVGEAMFVELRIQGEPR